MNIPISTAYSTLRLDAFNHRDKSILKYLISELHHTSLPAK